MRHTPGGPWRWVLLAGCVRLAGCSQELSGPTPLLASPASGQKVAPIDPGIVCRDQLTTSISVRGDKFVPVPIDLPKSPSTALPSIALVRTHELDGQLASPADRVVYSGDPEQDPRNAFDEGGQPLLFWISQQQMRFVIDQDLSLGTRTGRGLIAAGLWDVELRNPAGHSALSKQSLAVVDKPVVNQLTPGLTCLSQDARTLVLSGATFLQNGDDKATLEVDGVTEPFAVDLSDCSDIAHAGLHAQLCQTASAVLPIDAIPPGFSTVDVHNPATAACKSTDAIQLRVVPPPTVARVSPGLACLTERDRAFAIEGSDFLSVDGTQPTVAIGGQALRVDSMSGCEDLETQGSTVQGCTAIHVTLAQALLSPDAYSVSVQNPEPAGCDGTALAALQIVPPPLLTSVEALVCVDGGDRRVTVHGSDFLVVNSEVPAAKIDGQALPASSIEPHNCSELVVTGMSAQKCDTLILTLPKGNSTVGRPIVIEVKNPEPAGCTAMLSVQLTPAPACRSL